jgi:glucose dehydrogenase
MKLINDELQKRFKEVGRQRKNPVVIAKFFDPAGSGTWYATEYDPETNICYGYVTGLAYDEWGYFSIDEMESLKRPFGLTIERDLYFEEIPFNDLLTKIT